MKYICFVIGGMKRGGAERVISILANSYAEKGWRVDIIFMLNNEVEYEINAKVNIINLSKKGINRIKMIPYWLAKLRSIFKRQKPDVIVSFVARINVLVLSSTLGLNKKVIISERNDPAKDGRTLGIELFTKILYPKAEIIIFQTERAKKYFGKNIQNRSVIITNPISVMCEAQEIRNKKIVNVGRLAFQKNQKMLIDAFKIFHRTHRDYKLWIYGEGDLRRVLEEYIEEHNLKKDIFLAGNVKDVHSQISDAEMFVLSSNYEGLSNALLEAMMMGIASISTRCAGSDEYIKNYCNGLLVPIDDTNQLAKAMSMLSDNDALRNKISVNGKKSVEHCSSEVVIKEWKRVINDVLNK